MQGANNVARLFEMEVSILGCFDGPIKARLGKAVCLRDTLVQMLRTEKHNHGKTKG
jgi:hypothetical protein